MSATALRGAPPAAGAARPARSGEAALPRPPVPPPRSPGAAVAIRLAAVGALAGFGAQGWAQLVRPEATGRLLGAAGAGVAIAGLAILADRLRRPARLAGAVALPLAAVAAALLLAGVPLDLLDLESWGDLAAGLRQGFEALPGLNVPYRGLDEWNRVAMLLGGTIAAIAGVLVACWPLGGGRYGRPLAGVVVLAVLYAVPAVQLEPERPFLDGAVFAVLLAAAMWGERLARRETPLAVAAVAAAAIGGLALAPRLDARQPWIDYEAIAQSLGEAGTSTFAWNHSYGPLDWPRDGREVLRVRARTSSYWKATTLAEFDGVRWREVRPQGLDDDPEADAPRRAWVERLRVSVRHLRTRQFVSAGTTLRIQRSPRPVVRGAPGSFITAGRPLRRGHAYLVDAYVPRPRTAQLATAGAAYPTSLWPYLTMSLPKSIGGPDSLDPTTIEPVEHGDPAFVVFSRFGDRRPALGFQQGRGFGERLGTRWVRASRYGRTYALARRLVAASPTPYDFARRVQAYLQRGFTYSEAPPRSALPLDAFLFRDRAGYCQQFSGAMALLLRMGGVPARVATGFTPGTLDSERREYVVRDLDAHSWVEAYFPRYGWIAFDPTPAVAPPRAQLPALDGAAEAGDEGDESGSRGSERATDPRGIDRGATDTGGGVPLWLVVPGALLAAGVVALLVLVVRGRRRRARFGPDDALAELRRALRRTGRHPRPGLTLRALEDGMRWTPDAASYVRTLRDGRYGFGGGVPDRAQRTALRRELASGLGWRGRLRALWALPPW